MDSSCDISSLTKESAFPPLEFLPFLQPNEEKLLKDCQIEFAKDLLYKVPVSLDAGDRQLECSWDPYAFQIHSVKELQGRKKREVKKESESTHDSGTSSSTGRQPGPANKKSSRKYYKGPPTCQACNRDLKDLKEYYRRYRVCNTCQKAEYITIDGVNMRYCQQCGRFQALEDFDGSRRSCRQRLQLHNARRRKNATEKDSPTKAQQQPISNEMLNQPVGLLRDPAVVAFERKPTEMNIPISSSEFGNPNVQRVVGDTPLRLSQSRASGGSAYGRYGNADLVDDLLNNKSDFQFLPQIEIQPQTTPLDCVPNVESIQQHLDEQANRGENHSLPSSIPLFLSHPISLLNPQSHPLPQFQSLPLPLFHPLAHTEPQSAIEPPDDFMVELEQVLGVSASPIVSLPRISFPSNEVQPGSSLLYQNMNTEYTTQNKLRNLTLKLFECHPTQIPAGLKQHLQAAINMGIVVESFLRPGCIHFTADGIVPLSEQENTTAEEIANSLVGRDGFYLKRVTVLINFNGTYAMLRNGRVIQEAGLDLDTPLLHEIDNMIVSQGDTITIKGANLSGVEFLLRQNGRYFDFEILEESDVHFTLRIPQDVRTGLVKIQAQCGPCFSKVLACTVVEREIVEELHHLTKREREQMSIDLGLVLELSNHIFSKLVMGDDGRRWYSIKDVKTLVPIARRLLSYALVRGFASLANSLILPASTCCYSGRQLSDAVTSTTTNKLPLLFLAIIGKNPQTIRVLSTWSKWLGFVEERGFNVWGIVGPHFLTPLHLCALLDDEGQMATEIVELCPEAKSVLVRAKSSEGLSPYEFALRYASESTQLAFKSFLDHDVRDTSDCSITRHDSAHMSRSLSELSEIDGTLSPFRGLCAFENDETDGFVHTLPISESRNADVVGDSATQIETVQSKTFKD